jgi:hypothetical protein
MEDDDVGRTCSSPGTEAVAFTHPPAAPNRKAKEKKREKRERDEMREGMAVTCDEPRNKASEPRVAYLQQPDLHLQAR